MQWQQKLYQYTEEPPEQVWELLKKELEKEPFQLRSSLDALEEEPPTGAWDLIKAGINAESVTETETTTETPVVRFHRKRIFAYAAVIASTLLIISALVNLIRNENEGLNAESIRTSIGAGESKKIQPQVSYSDSNYILVPANDGSYNRVSYKLNDMVKSVYNTGQQDSQVRQRWNNTLLRWKQKMEHSQFMPTGSNFFDLAEMADVIDEK
ncbi:hypothetical protein [Pollutibacter soli]|uniref:hypothetical protein n=1 Tax=Pollutibacter soli TaxID=3034157 RepID=UPI003013DC8F